MSDSVAGADGTFDPPPKIDVVLEAGYTCYGLGELVNEIYAPLTLESMGEEKNYSSWYYAREFNVFERNLDAINQTSYNKVIGTTKTFFDNGPFIDSSELNRIESATLRLYEIGQNHKKTLPRLSVRLGSLKGVK